jgi:endonuclease/exonuclease/phosphatase family metal-dependent hydrolase
MENGAGGPARDPVTVTAYNIERGLRLDAIVELWRGHAVMESDVILLSEVDRGMARTGNRHVARDFARALGRYCYAYAAEFIELTKGSKRERKMGGVNTASFHGNAILSRYPLKNLEVVDLPKFWDYESCYERRIGARIALIADVDVPQGRITVVTTHLETHSSPQERNVQTLAILAALRRRDKGQPLIVGGDMNTSGLDCHRLVRQVVRNMWQIRSGSTAVLERLEPLFSTMRTEGFDYHHCNEHSYTLKESIYKAHLDWFFIKNVEAARISSARIHREFEDRHRFSDHLPIGVKLAL